MIKTWNIIFTALVGFISLNLSAVAMDGTCDYHRDSFTRNSRCHQGWCSVDKTIASRISQQLTEEREKKAAYWGVSAEKYKEMTTPTVYKIPHYQVSYSTTPLPYQSMPPVASFSPSYGTGVGNGVQQTYAQLERQFISDSKAGIPWSQERVDQAEISQSARNVHNERIGYYNSSYDDYDLDMIYGNNHR
jgi:hypothetical protein